MASVSPTKMLSTDESAIITINAIPEYNMIRTGVRGRGSCYLHALFTGISGREFRSLSSGQRDDLIHQYRQALASRITLEEYTHMLNGEFAKLQVFELLEKKMSRLYDTFPRNVKEKSYHHIPKDIRDKNPVWFPLQQEIFMTISNMIDIDAEIEKLDPILREPIQNVLQKALEKTFHNFKASLADYGKYIDQYSMKLIDEKLNVNVILINTNGSLYSTSDCEEMLQSGKNFVIVYYLNNVHFESVSRINEDGTVTSYFNPADPMIQQLLLVCR